MIFNLLCHPAQTRTHRWPKPAHRAVRLGALHAAGVVVPDAAGRFAFLFARFHDNLVDAGVATHARAVLGAQMDDVDVFQPDPDVARLLVVNLVGAILMFVFKGVLETPPTR